MLMDAMDDRKISHVGVDCLRQTLCKVDLPKAIAFVRAGSESDKCPTAHKCCSCLLLGRGGG